MKIPIKEAVTMLTERMEFEYQLRAAVSSGIGKIAMEELPFNVLLSIAEVAAFDLIFLLPAEVFEEENNLPDIITKSMHALAGVFGRKEFLTYPKKNAVNLVACISKVVRNSKETEVFSAN